MSNDALKRGVDKHCSIAYTIRHIRYETCKLSIALPNEAASEDLTLRRKLNAFDSSLQYMHYTHTSFLLMCWDLDYHMSQNRLQELVW